MTGAGARGRVLLAAGGTGGHMFPAQALAEELLARGWAVTLSTDARGARFTEGFPATVRVETVSSASPGRGGAVMRAVAPLRIGAGIAAAVLRMALRPPAVVVGFGGYPSVPALVAAWIMRRPRMIHEQNAVPGRVNRALACRVDRVACGLALAQPLPGAVVADIGNPVRAEVRARAGAPYIPPGDYPLSLLVIGGSQGARLFTDVVPEAVARLPADLRGRLRVAHQARGEDAGRAAAAYEAAGVPAEVEPFFTDIARRLSEAQLVISRAGASSIADIAAIGRPAILIPFAAAAGDHQTANARVLAEADAAVTIAESALDAGVLSAQMAALLQGPDVAGAMAERAARFGRPDAVVALADLVESLARGAQ